MPRDGSVGRETFEKVEALVKAGSSKTDAFKAVAEETGRNQGTVAANYYRVARASGAVKPRRGKRATTRSRKPRASATTRRGRRTAAASSDVDRLAAELVSNVQDLAAAIKRQQSDLDELRGRLEGVKQLLG